MFREKSDHLKSEILRKLSLVRLLLFLNISENETYVY